MEVRVDPRAIIVAKWLGRSLVPPRRFDIPALLTELDEYAAHH